MLAFVITLAVFLMVMAVLLWVKTPHYLMTKADVIALLQKVLVGQASENEWAIFLSSSFRHCPPLETIRTACAAIDETEYLGHTRAGFLFSEPGLAQLRAILQQVEALDIDVR
ncbi:hypothetical protein O59_001220 [Cellvibrio sp. BR]|jgi:hypothetical protein|uniref:hypothetical protein n=1 Tax=unclassified Cellvibrio TaxID=2624793 RepID=UPI0002600B36|nr:MULTISPECIES: hypothetical protein [unclassified Cellvibrio]EIK42829.1 hypothetical protein O59_001220 [Cellvibrio sp. BR]QEY12118.1 hypothetical protein D0B88_07505 [Cellvibrio sp. KY-YJ-3]UUA72334.1 hypothetical protein NNX04_18210 [Cellvibrio sp. QJXJ]